eukprot:scaffold24344_cov250-Cylindrotheca_fusiformis.AAC.1
MSLLLSETTVSSNVRALLPGVFLGSSTNNQVESRRQACVGVLESPARVANQHRQVATLDHRLVPLLEYT